MADVIVIEIPANPDVVEVSVVPEISTIEVSYGVPGVPGATGPQGPPGESIAFQYDQTTPLATWTIPLPGAFTRLPVVTVYVTGAVVIADVATSGSNVTITFASPVSGSAIIS